MMGGFRSGSRCGTLGPMATRREQLYVMTHAERVEHVRGAWSIDLEQAPTEFRSTLQAKGVELQAERELDR